MGRLKGPEAEAVSGGGALVFAVADGDDFDFAIGEALIFETELFGRTRGDVDDAAGDEGAAIVDAHFETFAVFEVGHFDHAGNGKGLVGGGNVPGHHFFAEGGVSALEPEKGRFVIPGGDSALFIMERLVD